MFINIDTNNDRPEELRAARAALDALLGDGSAPASATKTKAGSTKAKPPLASVPDPEPEPTPTPEPEVKAQPSVTDVPAGLTMQDAIDAASVKVSDGKSKQVKAVLTDMGVGRVSELSEGDFEAFITAVNEIG